jgi:hypothetical protein
VIDRGCGQGLRIVTGGGELRCRVGDAAPALHRPLVHQLGVVHVADGRDDQVREFVEPGPLAVPAVELPSRPPGALQMTARPASRRG